MSTKLAPTTSTPTEPADMAGFVKLIARAREAACFADL
jgi:hypothetical protein